MGPIRCRCVSVRVGYLWVRDIYFTDGLLDWFGSPMYRYRRIDTHSKAFNGGSNELEMDSWDERGMLDLVHIQRYTHTKAKLLN